MYYVILCFITSFTLTFVAIPSIINIAKVKRLMDEPGERRSHHVSIPTLGGIAIFAGVVFSIVLWTPFQVFGNLQYILCAYIIIFLIGAKDDIVPMPPVKKMAGQLFACAILVFKANIRITSFYGILNIETLPYWVSIVLSMFTILVIINSINLIDGINGLSASVGILISFTFGFWFLMTEQIVLAIIAFALIGALVAFLKYNVTPAKIFMGDTGSLLVGITCAILTLQFIEMHKSLSLEAYKVTAAPAVAIGVLFIALFDTLRVFILRILKGKSPLSPDRLHVHHIIVDSGLSHLQATFVLILINLFVILVCIKFQSLGNLFLLWILLLIGLILNGVLYLINQRNLSKNILLTP